MPVKNLVLTKLHRAEFNGGTQLHKNKNLNPTDGVAFSLFEQAKQQFNRSAAKRFGFFDAAAENKQLLGLINSWQAAGINFLSLGNKLSECLQQQLEMSETPFSGALLFAEESLLGQDYLYCFWLAMVETTQLGENLEPYRSESVDASKILYAFRLHINEWQDGDSPKYLTSIHSRGNKDLTDAFMGFSNFSEGIDIGQQTKEFLDIVSDYSDNMEEDDAKRFTTSVLDYCVEQDKVGNPVNVSDISEQLNQEEPQQFADFVSSRQEAPQAEIHTDRQSLKRYMRYFGRDNSLSISFSAERFGEDIIYHPTSGSLSINKLPKNLKTQLSGYLDKEG